MYRAVKQTGDAVAVPQLLFTKLAAPGADEARFRVALYLLAAGQADAAQIATALGLKPPAVERALAYWEGAGLIEREAAAQEEAAPPPKQKRLTMRETVHAGKADPQLGALLHELQRVYGTAIGPKPTSLFASLYVQDGFPPDLILLAASYAAARGITSAAYVESVLGAWRKAGIDNSAAADRHLRQMAQREEREKQLAEMMGLVWDPFTLADKRKIALWFEDYGYDLAMVDAARLAAGDKRNEVKYLAGILKKWHARGWQTPRDVQQGDEGRNLRVQSSRAAVAAGDDPLASPAEYVPMKRRQP